MITKNKLKKGVLILFAAFLLMQFIPKKYNESGQIEKTDIFKIYKAPQTVQNKIKTSCYDCHSNHTKYPWYNKIQPIALFLENHINEGKEELNFSEFGNYSKRKKKSKLKSIRSQIEKNEMPLKTYTFIHKEAILSKNDKTEILQWMDRILKDL